MLAYLYILATCLYASHIHLIEELVFVRYMCGYNYTYGNVYISHTHMRLHCIYVKATYTYTHSKCTQSYLITYNFRFVLPPQSSICTHHLPLAPSFLSIVAIRTTIPYDALLSCKHTMMEVI